MKCRAILLIFLTVIFSLPAISQTDEARANELQGQIEKADTTGWQYGMGIGLDFLQLLQFNPKVGAGENRLHLGGVSTLFADYKNNRLSWNNSGSLLFGVQKLGSGTTSIAGHVQKKPFQKTIDELRVVSNLSYLTSEDSKWSYSVGLTVLTQLAPTYSGNYLSDVTESGQGPIAKFFNPAQISLAPGMKYTHDEHFSVLFSPATVKAILVPDDEIASIEGDSALMVGLHGTEWKSSTDYKNSLVQFGASVRAKYQNKYFNDRLIVGTELTLFSNYLDNPQNIDVDFRNEMAIELFKGLQLSLIVNLYYDHDVPVQKTDWDAPDGIARNPDGTVKLIRALNVVETFAIKYNYIF